ncbi:hypothetical protein B0H34DRAFT_705799 [Crassisporium funariophilum]|nr:hypothetical protein B0H34DRAFT_705799 [Crassisporium funariophilum]
MEFLSLPPEIIEKVSEQLGGSHKKILRLVCKDLNSIIERQLFSNIILKYSNYQPELISAQLEALANRTTQARRHARSLEIRGFSPDSHLGVRSRSRSTERNRTSRSRSRGPLSDAHVVNKGILAHLGQAISSLNKVQNVWWQFAMNDPEWAKIVVMDSLASLPSLEQLRISLGGGSASSLRLEQLTNLRKISITGLCPDYRVDVIPGLRTLISNSPQLTHLDVDSGSYRADSETSTLHDLLDAVPVNSPLSLTHLSLRSWCVRLDSRTLPHLRTLESLTLYNTLDTRNQLFGSLDDLATDELIERTKDYCSTNDEVWDTLRREEIYLAEIATDEVCEALLDYLASYSGLKKFSLSGTKTQDSFSSDPLAMRFYDEVLPNHASTITVLDVPAEYEGKWCFGKHNASILQRCTKLANLRVSIHSQDMDREKEKDAVWSLLEIVDDLPYLSHLSISPADSEFNRGGSSFNHMHEVNKEISKSVTTFGPLETVKTPKLITTPHRDYVVRADEDAGGGLWYRSSMSQGSHLEL